MPRLRWEEVGALKILHVQDTLSPRYGGPASVLPQLVKAQAAAGCDVVVATTTADHPTGNYHEPGWDTLADGAVKVYYAPVKISTLRISPAFTSFMRRSISNFDIVHVHGLYRYPSTSAATMARRRKIPYIIRPHGSLDPYMYGKSTMGTPRLKRIYERLFDMPNLHGASAIHYTAEDEREKASFLNLRSPSFIASNGLDWQAFETLPARGAMRERWGVGEDPVVLFLGRLHFKKGLDLLIPAFDQVRKRIPNAQLVIAGPDNDDYERTVRGWVADRGLESAVHFVGTLHGADVVQAYVDADVFALPSYTENFGMTVVEAMACELPVVISDQVNIHAEISSAAAGLVTRCDADEVATALNALLGDASRRRSMGEIGRRLAKERYAWPSIVSGLTKEYEAVIARAHAQS